MNEVVVGVKLVRGAQLAAADEEPHAALQCLWVTIDGQEVPSNYIISASTIAENAPLVVELRIGASGFRTTDCYGPEAPERFRR